MWCVEVCGWRVDKKEGLKRRPNHLAYVIIRFAAAARLLRRHQGFLKWLWSLTN